MSSNGLEELKGNIKILSNKVDQISSKLNSIESLLYNGFGKTIKSSFGLLEQENVEIKENKGKEDMLLPQDVWSFPEGIKKTAMQLVVFRLASADDIAKITKRERAVESAYLNELESTNKCRKMRIGRKKYFYISNKIYLEPFLHINKEWRDVFVAILKTYPLENDEIEINMQQLRNTYRNSDLIPESISDNELTAFITSNLNEISSNSRIIQKNEKYDFIFNVHEWKTYSN